MEQRRSETELTHRFSEARCCSDTFVQVFPLLCSILPTPQHILPVLSHAASFHALCLRTAELKKVLTIHHVVLLSSSHEAAAADACACFPWWQSFSPQHPTFLLSILLFHEATVLMGDIDSPFQALLCECRAAFPPC